MNYLKKIMLASLALLLFVGCARSKTVNVQGQVIDDETGKPIRGAKVCMRTQFPNVRIMGVTSKSFVTTTDESGKFSFSRVRMSDELGTINHSTLHICVMKDGYDWTYASKSYFDQFSKSMIISLERDRKVDLPTGRIDVSDTLRHVERDQEIGFSFSQQSLVLTPPGRTADFQLRFERIVSKSHPDYEQYYLARIEASTERIGLVRTVYRSGRPPQLPDLSGISLGDRIDLGDGFKPNRHWKEEFDQQLLIQTTNGSYALVKLIGLCGFGCYPKGADKMGEKRFGRSAPSQIQWVLQPNGSTDLSFRRRKDNVYSHCGRCATHDPK